jgi:hypothetical protein
MALQRARNYYEPDTMSGNKSTPDLQSNNPQIRNMFREYHTQTQIKPQENHHFHPISLKYIHINCLNEITTGLTFGNELNVFFGKNQFKLTKRLKSTQVHNSDTPSPLSHRFGGGVGSKSLNIYRNTRGCIRCASSWLMIFSPADIE